MPHGGTTSDENGMVPAGRVAVVRTSPKESLTKRSFRHHPLCHRPTGEHVRENRCLLGPLTIFITIEEV